MTPLDVVEIINGALGLLNKQISDHGITYTSDHQKNLPLVQGDAHSLEQVFSHLIINAIHALETRNRSERKFSVKTYQWGGKVVVEMIDTGCGMPKSVQTRIFDPFYTTKDPEKGTGLGMTIVESALHNHGATIDLESTVKVGTKVTISFPVELPKETSNDA